MGPEGEGNHVKVHEIHPKNWNRSDVNRFAVWEVILVVLWRTN